MRTLAISHQRDAGPGVFAEAIAAAGHELDVWHVAETDRPPADPLGYDAVMTFGGAMHADHDDRHPWLRPEKELLARLLDAGVPLLGVCLGSQLLAEAGGGGARRASEPEIGWHAVEVTEAGAADPLLGPLAPGFEAFQWHSYECLPPPGAEVLARSPVCVQAYRLGGRAWGIQFHAEVSRGGRRVLDRRLPRRRGRGPDRGRPRRCSVPRRSPADRRLERARPGLCAGASWRRPRPTRRSPASGRRPRARRRPGRSRR